MFADSSALGMDGFKLEKPLLIHAPPKNKDRDDGKHGQNFECTYDRYIGAA